MRPVVGSIMRLIIRRVVVLPQPDGPRRATIDPLATSRLRPPPRPTASAPAPGKRLVTSINLIAAAPAGGSVGVPVGVVDKHVIIPRRPTLGPVPEVLVVSGEPVSGGDGRTAALVEALSARCSVLVLAPGDGLPDEKPAPRLVSLLSPQPRLGRALLGPARSRALLQALADHRPRAVLFVGSHLAAASPTIDLPIFVDMPTLAVRGTGVEGLKARWWEAVEARRAVAVSASSAADVELLTSWGARAVLVPDGSSAAGWGPLAEAVEQVVRASAGS